MTQNPRDWGTSRPSRPLTLEADFAEHVAWYRRPIVILALVGALIAAGAAVAIGGGGPGIDSMTTGTVETDEAAPADPALVGLPQFDGI